MDALLALKPVLAALVLPPAGLLIPLAGLLLWTGPFQRVRKATGLLLIVLLWLTSCLGTGRWLIEHVLQPPPVLDIKAWQFRLSKDPAQRAATSVLVLGAGRYTQAGEYGPAQGALTATGRTRLEYGLWLSRQLGSTLSYAGGIGWAQHGEVSEADVAEQILHDQGVALRVKEGRSRDTRENAEQSMPALKAAGVQTVILVTHCWHMPRALLHFSEAAASAGIELVPAPIEFPTHDDLSLLDWVPSGHGHRLTVTVLHEVLGRLVRA